MRVSLSLKAEGDWQVENAAECFLACFTSNARMWLRIQELQPRHDGGRSRAHDCDSVTRQRHARRFWLDFDNQWQQLRYRCCGLLEWSDPGYSVCDSETWHDLHKTYAHHRRGDGRGL